MVKSLEDSCLSFQDAPQFLVDGLGVRVSFLGGTSVWEGNIWGEGGNSTVTRTIVAAVRVGFTVFVYLPSSRCSTQLGAVPNEINAPPI